MGTGEKKERREIQRVLHKFMLRDDSGDYPVKEHPEARDMIIEYAEPVEGLFESLVTRYSIAVFAWNLSLVPDERRTELINEFISPLLGENDEGREAITEVMLVLVARRIELYPEESFLILPMESTDDEENEEFRDEIEDYIEEKLEDDDTDEDDEPGNEYDDEDLDDDEYVDTRFGEDDEFEDDPYLTDGDDVPDDGDDDE